MKQRESTWLHEVAACTTGAAHRRDHRHADEADCCHPHAVEVVCLGEQGVVVCHDCETDSGFVSRRDADRMAAAHRLETIAASPRLLPRSA